MKRILPYHVDQPDWLLTERNVPLCMFADRTCEFIYDAFYHWASLFYCCLCCLGSFAWERKIFNVDEQYINAHMTLNTQYQNMTFKAFIYLTIKWQHPRGSFRGMPARRLLWILWFHCKGNVNLLNVNIFVHLLHVDCNSFLRKNGTDHSDTAHWTSNWLLKPNLKKFPATAVVPT